MKTNDIKSFTTKELISTVLTVDEIENGSKKTAPVIRDALSILNDKKENTTFEDLVSVEGIGKETAIKLLACFEIARRYRVNSDSVDKITRPEDCVKYLEAYRREKQEYFITISLNGAGEIIEVREITKGLLNHSLVHPREVYAPAITDRAASIICAHNHPSGSLDPSPQDIAITTQLKEAGLLLGIQLLDHIIVTKGSFLSMKERGLM